MLKYWILIWYSIIYIFTPLVNKLQPLLLNLEKMGTIGSQWACVNQGIYLKLKYKKLNYIKVVKAYIDNKLVLIKDNFTKHIDQIVVIPARLLISV